MHKTNTIQLTIEVWPSVKHGCVNTWGVSVVHIKTITYIDGWSGVSVAGVWRHPVSRVGLCWSTQALREDKASDWVLQEGWSATQHPVSLLTIFVAHDICSYWMLKAVDLFCQAVIS